MKVALVHRDHPRLNQDRMIGMWSYTVPEFNVTHINVAKGEKLYRSHYADYDVIFWEDSRATNQWVHDADIPLVYLVGDSTLSQEHYHHRRTQSEYADLILVDWDRLGRFNHKPVQRLSYCVNDQIFYPNEKVVDVGFFAHMDGSRRELDLWLRGFCDLRGYRYASGSRVDMAYCEAIGSAKVNINLNRNAFTRAHRCYDVMASRSCLITSPMPVVSGEDWRAGYHYLEFETKEQLAAEIDYALTDGAWQWIAANAEHYITDHTWAARAKHLHTILQEFIAHDQHTAQTTG